MKANNNMKYNIFCQAINEHISLLKLLLLVMMSVHYEYYLHKQAKHCFHKSFFPNECKMLLSAPHHLNLIIHVGYININYFAR